VDIRAQQAREHHKLAAEDEAAAARHREQRDRLVRQLRADDPRRWTYPALAGAVGCSPELIAHIIRTTMPAR
jgi:AraC-like DNA-binding protein